MVVVDYPDDVIVTVNAKIRKLEGDMISPVSSDVVDDMDHLKRNDHDEVVTGQNEANVRKDEIDVSIFTITSLNFFEFLGEIVLIDEI